MMQKNYVGLRQRASLSEHHSSVLYQPLYEMPGSRILGFNWIKCHLCYQSSWFLEIILLHTLASLVLIIYNTWYMYIFLFLSGSKVL